MIAMRRAEHRRHVRNGRHDRWMTFDADRDDDPWQHGFCSLETLNEDSIGPATALVSDARSKVDLVTYVEAGELVRQDGDGELRRHAAGEFHRRSAEAGASYRAINDSFGETAHVFQGGLTRDVETRDSADEQQRFTLAEREGVLRLVASPDGRHSSLSIDRDIRVYSSILGVGSHAIHELDAGRRAWLHVVKGRIRLQALHLRTGDGAALVDERAVSFTAEEPSEVLLFDLPSPD